ncbi:MAG: 50S ribosomal protein L13 [Bacteroidia bacterium]|nr:50S ribosomal protein L13 [Bacteroidia bacterium]
MDTLSYRTVSANSATVTKNWVIVDAENQVVGRLATQIASILRGKTKAYFTPHVDCGDYVIVINAEKVRFTGNKLETKQYVRHTGYPGGQRFATPKELFAKHPTRVMEYAIKRMLPKNKLGAVMFGNLHIYAGTTHPHEAQKPVKLNLTTTTSK